jgi:hypothetical protein
MGTLVRMQLTRSLSTSRLTVPDGIPADGSGTSCFEIGQSGSSGLLEGSLVGGLPEDKIKQTLQMPGFPSVQAGLVDFHQSFQVRGRDNELIWLQKSADYFVISA